MYMKNLQKCLGSTFFDDKEGRFVTQNYNCINFTKNLLDIV